MIYQTIIQGYSSGDQKQVGSAFTEDARMLMLKDHMAGRPGISWLFTRAGQNGFQLDAVKSGRIVWINSTMLMEENAEFESNLGKGRIFNIWKLVPKAAPANSVPEVTIDDAHANDPKNSNVMLWRSIIMGPNVKPPTSKAKATKTK